MQSNQIGGDRSGFGEHGWTPKRLPPPSHPGKLDTNELTGRNLPQEVGWAWGDGGGGGQQGWERGEVSFNENRETFQREQRNPAKELGRRFQFQWILW